MPHDNNEKNKETKSIDNNCFSENSIFTLILLIFIINKLNDKNPASSELKDDEYMVTMGENPAFPLEDDKRMAIRKKRSFINLENQKDLFSLMDILKPHMSTKNRELIVILERWLILLKDLHQLTSSIYAEDSMANDIGKEQPKSLIKFLYDIKPFIHSDYHVEIEEFTQGINSILDVQNNIYNLQYALNQAKDSNEDITKINTIINALHPFMGENHKKNLEKFKQLSTVMEMINISEDIISSKEAPTNHVKDTTLPKEDKSELMEILDILDKPISDTNQGKDYPNKEPNQITQEPKIEEIPGPTYIQESMPEK